MDSMIAQVSTVPYVEPVELSNPYHWLSRSYGCTAQAIQALRGENSAMKEFSSRLTYPNPFNPSGLEFDLPAIARVTLQIFDMEGKEIAALLQDQELQAGKHTVEFYDARGEVRWGTNHADGRHMFFYRLSVEIGGERHTHTKRIVLS